MYDFDPLYSAYPEYKNTIVDWCGAPNGTDSESTYLDNIKKNNHMMSQYGWDTEKVKYKFNSYGFRSDEFKTPKTPSIIFLGCSYTFGMGINIENSFSHIVSRELGLKNYNLGIGAGSSDSSFRIGHYWIPKLKPSIVVFTNIFIKRCENILKPNNACEQIVGPYSSNEIWKHYSQVHWEINNLKGLYALKYICDKENIPLYNITEFERLDLARDLLHPGIISNEQVAEDILTQIQNRGEYNGI